MTKDTPANTYYCLDIALLILMPIVAAIATLVFSVNLLESTLLFFGLPAAYLSLRRKGIILRSLVYATTIAVISILTDYLAERDQSWVSTSIFEIRIAESVPIEALVWLFLFTYLIVAYFQYFHDRSPHRVIGKRMPLVFLTALAVIAWVGLTALTDAHFTVEYYYIKFGLAFLLAPLIVFLLSFPRYLKTLLKIMPYFFAVGLLNLIVSLDQGLWAYPGQNFVGWVRLGSYRFPIEELVFWIILYAPFLISQFELFNNDALDLRTSKLMPKSGRKKS